MTPSFEESSWEDLNKTDPIKDFLNLDSNFATPLACTTRRPPADFLKNMEFKTCKFNVVKTMLFLGVIDPAEFKYDD